MNVKEKNISDLNEVNYTYVIRVTMKSRADKVPDQVSPEGRVLLEMLITAQLFKFSPFYGTQTFITTLTKAHYWTLF
jgi:hypothetical protein